MHDISFSQAIEKADHLKALGWTDVYLGYRQTEFPWGLVTDVQTGHSHRLSGPASVRMTARHPSGLTFSWEVDFEGRDANGRGVHLFDRDRLRDVMRKLPKPARIQFANILASEVFAGMQARTSELRKALSDQEDSEDLVRGLIAFAESV